MDWKKLVGSVAPVLGTALGGPFGGLAGKFLADKLGVSQEELPVKVESADPQTMLAIKNSEQEFKKVMRELDIKEADLHAKDRQSARDMAKSTTLTPQIIQSVMYDIAFIFVCWFVFTSDGAFSDTQERLLMFLLGILSAGLVQVNNFWFGSSSGSKEKTLIMGKPAAQ